MAAYAVKEPALTAPMQREGVTVTGEAVRRITPESAEFVAEVTTTAQTAAQALRDSLSRFNQLAQALQPLGVHLTDLQPISQNVTNLYGATLPSQGFSMPSLPVPGFGPGFGPSFGISPMQSLQAYGIPLMGQSAFSGYGGSGLQSGSVQTVMSPEVQFGSYCSRSVIRVNVRDVARAGEVVDAVTRAGAIVSGGVQFKASDEANVRKSALEEAGKDARVKAEALAAAAGKQIGDVISISEEVAASNGIASALRSAAPFTFGSGTPRVIGELEYYARVSASFRLQ